MESASTSDERAPLLGDFRIDISPDEQTSIGGNTFEEEAPLDGNCTTSKEKTPHLEQGETKEVSLEEVVQAMCAAWRKHREPKDRTIDYRMSKESNLSPDFFSLKEAYAMRLAWQNLTRGRHCASKPHIIGEAVGIAIAKELLPVPQCEESDILHDYQMQLASKKNTITANFLDYWWVFADDDLNDILYVIPIRYIETMFEGSDRQPVAAKFWFRLVERYDKVKYFFLNDKLQLLLHSLLFFWPIFFLIIGSKYMDCPIGHHLSHLMMAVGCVGGFATLFRLALMYLSQGEYVLTHFWKWKCLRWTELTFLIIFFVQAFYFFYIDPVTEVDPNQCGQAFYNAALVINYASIPLAAVYVFAYSIVIGWNNFDFWIWIVRNL